jgi:hypothetical protein
MYTPSRRNTHIRRTTHVRRTREEDVAHSRGEAVSPQYVSEGSGRIVDEQPCDHCLVGALVHPSAHALHSADERVEKREG